MVQSDVLGLLDAAIAKKKRYFHWEITELVHSEYIPNGYPQIDSFTAEWSDGTCSEYLILDVHIYSSGSGSDDHIHTTVSGVNYQEVTLLILRALWTDFVTRVLGGAQ